MPDITQPVNLVLRNDGQVADDSGTILYPSIDAVRAAYDLPQDEPLVWPVGYVLRFPR